jgi:signal transduction histidine kinase
MSQCDNVFYSPFTGHERLKVVLFSLFSLCVLAVSLAFFTFSISKPYIGIMLSMDEQDWVVRMVDTNGVAAQAGIGVGDKPIEINGQPAKTFLEKYEKSGMVFGQLIRKLTVVDDRGQLKAVALEDGSPSWESMSEPTAWLVISLIFWITGFYVFFKRPRNVAALLLCICGLTFGLALSASMAAERAIPTALQFEITASVFGPWLLLHFFVVLPEKGVWLRNNPLVYLIYLPAAITLVLFPIIGYADGQPLSGFRTFRLFEYGAGFLGAASVVIFNYFHTTSVKTRQQMKIVLISCLAALVPIVILNLLPQVIWRQPVVPPGFSILFMVFIPLGMGYAVVTQKLMDIDVVIRRGIIYGLITVVMAVILSAVIFPAVTHLKSVGTPAQILVALGLGGVAAALFGPAKKGIEVLVDRLFYKDRYDYRQIIQSLGASLNSVREFADTLRLIVGTTVHTLNLAGGCLFVKGRSDSLEANAAQGTFTDGNRQKRLLTLISQRSRTIEFPNSATSIDPDVAFLIPLIAGEKEVGILCLSQKNSRQDFSSDDLFLLQGVASVGAIALRNAMLIRDVSMRDTFVSIASHELRTPLTAIMGYAELLLRRDPPDVTRKRWVKNIVDNGQRITDIVDDLLNVTRIQSGKVGIKLDRVKLFDVLAECLAIVREGTSKHEFVVDIEPDLPDVLVDRDKFGQVVGNLLSNAIKYSPNGGRITLSAHNDLQGHRVVASVADEGIGIGPTDKDSLFTTFHRIRRPETQGIRGSGLGLYIVKEWMEAMGGEVWLESELNKGSTFFIAVPIADFTERAE